MSHVLFKASGSFFITLLLLVFCGCAIAPTEQLDVSQSKRLKWVPYSMSSPSESPAFIMILESADTTCAEHTYPEQCRLWEELPDKALPIGRDEVRYLADYHGKGYQPVRISRESHCAITEEEHDQTSCKKRWWYFVRKKLSEES